MLDKLKNNFTFPFFLLNLFSIIIMVWMWFESSENFIIILITYLIVLITWFIGCYKQFKAD